MLSVRGSSCEDAYSSRLGGPVPVLGGGALSEKGLPVSSCSRMVVMCPRSVSAEDCRCSEDSLFRVSA